MTAMRVTARFAEGGGVSRAHALPRAHTGLSAGHSAQGFTAALSEHPERTCQHDTSSWVPPEAGRTMRSTRRRLVASHLSPLLTPTCPSVFVSSVLLGLEASGDSGKHWLQGGFRLVTKPRLRRRGFR
ncbi:hypothetical protein CKAH01_04648 [Colletotrichum kahawae]|uniref:Uncharacterized protein n=1 Tax=Colletotrichum kahawae TaxID=34407 RepID=A0AAD9YJ56_COLKA|nr:hypothetical protein CKAH01_04648 [Colletotrichum kahawae]